MRPRGPHLPFLSLRPEAGALVSHQWKVIERPRIGGLGENGPLISWRFRENAFICYPKNILRLLVWKVKQKSPQSPVYQKWLGKHELQRPRPSFLLVVNLGVSGGAKCRRVCNQYFRRDLLPCRVTYLVVPFSAWELWRSVKSRARCGFGFYCVYSWPGPSPHLHRRTHCVLVPVEASG